MKFILAAVTSSALLAFVQAKPATKFSAKEWKANHCLTLDKYLRLVPSCAVNCLELGLDGSRDGCAPDDMVCHCQHTQRIDDILVPCIQGADSPNATCSNAEIGQLQGIVTNLCTFYNATGYSDYVGCDLKLTMEIAKEKLGIL